jgi:hypothetical protein
LQSNPFDSKTSLLLRDTSATFLNIKGLQQVEGADDNKIPHSRLIKDSLGSKLSTTLLAAAAIKKHKE